MTSPTTLLAVAFWFHPKGVVTATTLCHSSAKIVAKVIRPSFTFMSRRNCAPCFLWVLLHELTDPASRPEKALSQKDKIHGCSGFTKPILFLSSKLSRCLLAARHQGAEDPNPRKHKQKRGGRVRAKANLSPACLVSLVVSRCEDLDGRPFGWSGFWVVLFAGAPCCRGVSRTIARAVGGRDESGLRPVLVFWLLVRGGCLVCVLWVRCVASVFGGCQDSSGHPDHCSPTQHNAQSSMHTRGCARKKN